jgi:probable rRNA maturation factor
MIVIRNRQRTIIIDVEMLMRDAQNILRYVQYEDYDLSIVITNDRTMRTYNRTFRQKDKTTDILSFPFYPYLKPGERIDPQFAEEKILGDLIISAPAVVRDAHAAGVELQERLRELLVHGILHLLGYDHIDDADYAIMHAEEQCILQKLMHK